MTELAFIIDHPTLGALEPCREKVQDCLREMRTVLTKLETGEFSETEIITKVKLIKMIGFLEAFDYKTKKLTLEEITKITTKFRELFPHDYKFQKPIG